MMEDCGCLADRTCDFHKVEKEAKDLIARIERL